MTCRAGFGHPQPRSVSSSILDKQASLAATTAAGRGFWQRPSRRRSPTRTSRRFCNRRRAPIAGAVGQPETSQIPPCRLGRWSVAGDAILNHGAHRRRGRGRVLQRRRGPPASGRQPPPQPRQDRSEVLLPFGSTQCGPTARPAATPHQCLLRGLRIAPGFLADASRSRPPASLDQHLFRPFSEFRPPFWIFAFVCAACLSSPARSRAAGGPEISACDACENFLAHRILHTFTTVKLESIARLNRPSSGLQSIAVLPATTTGGEQACVSRRGKKSSKMRASG